jgi:hypothetical protein
LIHYPISLANCGTTDGNIAVLEEFCQSLGIEKMNSKNNVYLCYNAQKSKFDLNQSRAKKVFIDRVQRVIEHQRLEPDSDSQIFEDCGDIDGATEDDYHDRQFETTYLELRQSLYNAHNLPRFIASVQCSEKLNIKDKFGRTMLHFAVENEHLDMIDLMFSVGCNPNAKENIGITPLCIAVIKENFEICKLLLQYGADCMCSTPSALEIGHTCGQQDIITLFEDILNKRNAQDKKLSKQCGKAVVCTEQSDSTVTEEESSDENYNFQRTNFKLPIFGDNGTEKQVRAIKIKSGMFDMFCECPGDLHASAYAAECMAKTMGSAGMYHCLAHILNRKNNADTFGGSKFQHGNLQSNAEACKDIAMGYGLSCFQSFKTSEYFPRFEIDDADDKGSLLLSRFKLFIKDLSNDERCRYYLQAVTLFGPWLYLYKRSVRSGYGLGREVSWLIGLQIYGPLKKKNYFAAAFVHCVNLNYAWAPLLRDLVSAHAFISVRNVSGHMLAVDEYVETFMVRPLKMYVTGRTTVKMARLLSVSTQLIKQIKDSYTEAFSHKKSSTHKIPDSVLDQMKVCNFATKYSFFVKTNDSVKVFSADGPTDQKLGKNYLNILDQGKQCLTKSFSAKMFTYFPQWRNRPLS